LDVKNASPAIVDAAKNLVKRLKMLRHPSVLTFLESVEVFTLQFNGIPLCYVYYNYAIFHVFQSDKAIYLATECVEPLEKYLERRENPQGDLSVAWGLFQVTV
jgi:SCY1-like protein 1